MTEYVLLSDISNGFHQKLALARRGERPRDVAHYACNGLAEFKGAISDFLASKNRPRLSGAAISAAGWERDGITQLPNHSFAIDRVEMRQFLDVQRLNLVNNMVSKALAVPRLDETEYEKICGGDMVAEQVIAVLGPTAGLGQSALVPDGMGNWMAIPCEGGHSDVAATNPIEEAVLKVLQKKHGHVSRERVISIPALTEIWQALATIAKDNTVAPAPEDIVAKARAGDERSAQTIRLMTGWFAAMASDVALMLGARGGVYLGGDLLDMIGDLFDTDAFAERYADKGRLTNYVMDIPVFKTTARDMEIIGLATLFD